MKQILKIILIITCCLCFKPSFGQNKRKIDSLLHIIKKHTKDTIKVNAFNELAWEYHRAEASEARKYAGEAIKLSESLAYESGRITGWVRLGQVAGFQKEYKKAESIFLKVLDAEKKIKHQYGIGRAQSALSEIYLGTGNLKKALDYGLEALAVFEAMNSKSMIALIANKIGAIYEKMGVYDKATRYFLKGLEIREQMGNQKNIGFSYLDIGIFHKTLQDYPKALDYLEKSRVIFETLNYKDGLAKVYNNLGVVHFKMNYYNTALSYYQKSLYLKKQLGLGDKDPGIYNNIGIIYYEKNDLDKALEYFLKSILIYEKNTSGSAFVDTYSNLGDIYYRKENYEKAIEYHQKALKTAEKQEKNVIRLKLFNSLSKSYEKLQQPETALQYSNYYIKLNDSIERTYKTAVQLKADYDEQQKENIILEKDKELLAAKNKRKNTLIYSLIVGLLLAILLFFSILYGNKQKQKTKLAEKKVQLEQKNRQIKEQEIEELLKNQELKSMNAMIEGQEEERKRIAQDLHDRLGSMLAVVKIHYKSVEENIENLKIANKKQYEKANDLLDSACEEVRKIAHNMTSGVLMKFGLVAALEDLKEKLEQTKQISVEFIAHGLDNRLDNDVEIPVYRIIQELISNVLKYAKAKEITIQLIRNNQGLHITVEDNGIGFDVNSRKDSGMGLKNVASRVNKLNGELHIDSTPGNGTTITIDIPFINN